MGSRLSIKSEDAYGVASRLAELTGESLTSAVTIALRSGLKRRESARDIDAEIERMLASRSMSVNRCGSKGTTFRGPTLNPR